MIRLIWMIMAASACIVTLWFATDELWQVLERHMDRRDGRREMWRQVDGLFDGPDGIFDQDVQ